MRLEANKRDDLNTHGRLDPGVQDRGPEFGLEPPMQQILSIEFRFDL